MKTHMSNTKAKELYTDVMGKTAFYNHQAAIYSQKVKPIVVTRRKEQVKITTNNKREINQNPRSHVHHLFNNLIKQSYKSNIDNKVPKNYENGKKILKDKTRKNRYEIQAQKEHQKELESQMHRVKNCKSLVQRKKDNNDPIVNPTYVMRENEKADSVAIVNYKQKVLNKNRPSSAKPAGNVLTTNLQSNRQTHKADYQPHYALGSVPNYSKKPPQRPQSAKNAAVWKSKTDNQSLHASDLPPCTFKALLHHIVENKMWRDTEMKVLYVRLCHKYGEDKVDQVWDLLMDQLEK